MLYANNEARRINAYRHVQIKTARQLLSTSGFDTQDGVYSSSTDGAPVRATGSVVDQLAATEAKIAQMKAAAEEKD